MFMVRFVRFLVQTRRSPSVILLGGLETGGLGGFRGLTGRERMNFEI
jgi:hypothetical protein